jgi:LysM repeat protein
MDNSVLILEGLQTSVADAQRSQHANTTELEILEERVNRQESKLTKTATLEQKMAALEAKFRSLEKRQEQTLADIRKIGKLATATDMSIASLKQEMSTQMANMKGALEAVVAVAKAGQQTSYQVKSGDTLERIAGRQGTTVAAIQRANNLSTDRIIVGQELVIPGQ